VQKLSPYKEEFPSTYRQQLGVSSPDERIISLARSGSGTGKAQ
jgi:hypothetical protein